MNQTFLTAGTLSAVAAGVALLTATPASADVKLVSQVSVAGLPSQTQSASEPRYPQIDTTLYKGSKARTDTAPADAGDSAAPMRTTLYDFHAGTVTVLDPSAKTYYTRPLSAVQDGLKLPDRFAGRANLDVEMHVDADKTASPSTIAGQSVQPYDLNGSIKVALKSRGGGMGRLRRRRGGFGGGATGGSGMGGGGARRSLPSVEIGGQVQAAGEKSVLGTDGKDALTPFVCEMFPGGMGVKPLLDRFADRKAIPLQGSITFTRSGGSAETSPTPPITVTLQVTSIDTDAHIDDALFAIPSGYRQVDPPADSASALAVLRGGASSSTATRGARFGASTGADFE